MSTGITKTAAAPPTATRVITTRDRIRALGRIVTARDAVKRVLDTIPNRVNREQTMSGLNEAMRNILDDIRNTEGL